MTEEMSTLLRLNLGCGNKILDGYVNIDIEAPPGEAPKSFRKGDIRDLKSLGYEDNSVDEILLVHTLEHFHIWEVPSLMAEWRRALKKDGLFIVEVPDILKCAINLLSMRTVAMPQVAINQGMWGFYGDPGARSSINTHKWGYFAESLITALKLAEFREVREEPAQYHMGPVRDLRIVGVK